jgi:hypothetical protein
MTETEWKDCKDARAMLRFLRDKSGERKMRLLACACARFRSVEPIGEEDRRAIETAERCADGLAGFNELRAADYELWLLGFSTARVDHIADVVVSATVEDFSGDAAATAIKRVPNDAPDLIREIFGNPFRNACIDSAYSGSSGGRLEEMARTIYENHRFEDLPLLADLLSESGCGDEELLTHLRSPGPHFRGCWALDAVLVKGPGKDLLTEKEWLEDTHPYYLLNWWEYFRGDISPRKSRLLACECCRLIWSLFTDERLRHAVKVAEAFADGLVGQTELDQIHEYASSLSRSTGEDLSQRSQDSPQWTELSTVWRVASAAASTTFPDGRVCSNVFRDTARDSNGRDTIDVIQADLIREILGNPLREVMLDPTWLRWNNGIVASLAKSIYDEKAFDRMTILADALEEAGCTNDDILNHCRQPGEHVRGCWVVDLILGKS